MDATNNYIVTVDQKLDNVIIIFLILSFSDNYR